MLRVYLAGPIKGLVHREAVEWREIAAQRLAEKGIETISPMRGREYLIGKGEISPDMPNLAPHFLSERSSIMRGDFFDINRSDAVLVYFLGAKKISIGTVWETGVAYQANIPVVTVMEPEGNVHDHIMIRGSSLYTVHDLDTGIEAISRILLP